MAAACIRWGWLCHLPERLSCTIVQSKPSDIIIIITLTYGNTLSKQNVKTLWKFLFLFSTFFLPGTNLVTNKFPPFRAGLPNWWPEGQIRPTGVLRSAHQWVHF